MDKIATTIACYGNLYLSDQLDIDEWIIYAHQFRERAFQFYYSDGQLFADYLAQWLEYQKKYGAKRFFLQLPENNHDTKAANLNSPYLYRNEFSIICEFESKQEIWTCCYPKTIAASSNLKLENGDSYAGHHCRPTTFVLTQVNTISSPTELLTDWQALKTQIIHHLNQLWPTNEDVFSSNDYYYDEKSSIKEFPWYLPIMPPDRHLIIPHQLLIGLEKLDYIYKNNTTGKNEGNVFYTLPKDELDRFLAHGELIRQWTKKVLRLASLETRWQMSPDVQDENQQAPKTNQTQNTNSINQSIKLENPTKNKLNGKKGCLILSVILLAIVIGIGYALYQQLWLTVSVLLLIYIIIKK